MSQNSEQSLIKNIVAVLNQTNKIGQKAFGEISNLATQLGEKIGNQEKSLQAAATSQNATTRNAAEQMAQIRTAQQQAEDKAKTAEEAASNTQKEAAEAAKAATAAAEEVQKNMVELQKQLTNSGESSAGLNRTLNEVQKNFDKLQKENQETSNQLAQLRTEMVRQTDAHKDALAEAEKVKDQAVNDALRGTITTQKCLDSVKSALGQIQKSTDDIRGVANQAKENASSVQRGGFRSSSAPVKRGSLKKYRSSSRSYTSKGYKKNKNTKKIFFKPKKGKKSRK